jgi:hypothetical protein
MLRIEKSRPAKLFTGCLVVGKASTLGRGVSNHSNVRQPEPALFRCRPVRSPLFLLDPRLPMLTERTGPLAPVSVYAARTTVAIRLGLFPEPRPFSAWKSAKTVRPVHLAVFLQPELHVRVGLVTTECSSSLHL